MVINCKGSLVDISKPTIMGILNITPDSFYAGSRLQNKDAILKAAEQMLTEGATILDIGGASSRPGANPVTEEEELKRVIPAIELITQEFPEALISVDTYRSSVLAQAVTAGIHLVNDISASSLDDKLFDVVAASNLPYILMHMQGEPKTMQAAPQYNDVLTNVMDFFIKKVAILRNKGVKDIILDVGFGFGKTIEHNYKLLNNLQVYQTLNLPMLVGLSRKSMIWKTLNCSPNEALNGTTALHMVALQQGANILRVHDVKAAKETIQLWQLLEEHK